MLVMQVSKCPLCGELPPQRQVTEEGEGFRAVAVLECLVCGNTRLQLADFWPRLPLIPFRLGESFARSLMGNRN